ncbi:enoyl-CoA hydratase [Miltoncostaea marina]|uniref:enoyl-CoA hydratase n=1 Tax=Miltoncostaea marina TaxID=2843215 RepID=UPI001C3CA286|nr:enoyl-CoA hydratase [Miltoncostaea marina]
MSEATIDHGPVTEARDGALVTLVLARPERRNPLALTTMELLTAALRRAGDDPAVRAVVIGAEGPVFSAGHDLREVAAAGPEGHERIFAACAELMMTVHRLPVPVIARVQGLATAAGCQLVAACDLAVASETASFATPGVRIGLFCSTPQVEVVRAVGHTRAMEMLLTGEPIDAATALAWGLVNRVVPAPGLEAAAAALARRVAEAGRATVASGKRAVADTIDLPLDEAYRHASRVMARDAGAPEAREGIDAFLGKRAPVWPGPA